MNADNATSNDTQGEVLAGMPNTFVLEHRVRCFNHTLQLSAKTLLRPFNTGLSKAAEDADTADTKDVDDLLDSDSDSNSEDGVEGKDEDGDGEDLSALADAGDINDGIDELGALDAATCDEILTDTAAVCETVTKLRRLSFSIV
jgi:hypothetical protein